MGGIVLAIYIWGIVLRMIVPVVIGGGGANWLYLIGVLLVGDGGDVCLVGLHMRLEGSWIAICLVQWPWPCMWGGVLPSCRSPVCMCGGLSRSLRGSFGCGTGGCLHIKW